MSDASEITDQSVLLFAPVRTEQARKAERCWQLGYRPALDGLRGVAVLLVIAHHARLAVATGGFLGVEVFFVLSGFLITTLLLEEWERAGAISLKHFYLRRALRLLPALAVLLGCLTLYAALFLPQGQAVETYRAAAATLFYLSNWVEAFQVFSLGLLYHTWSLAIEEQFYLLWPPLLVLLLRMGLPRRWIALLVLAGAALTVWQRAALWQDGVVAARLYNGLDTRADALLCGCGVGLLATNDWPKIGWLATANKVMLVTLSLAFVYLLVRTNSASSELYLGGFTIVSVATVAAIIELLGQPLTLLRQWLESPALVWMGKLSYGLYLWNFPACYIIYKPHWPWAATMLLQLVATFAAASLSYYLIERRFLHLKKRWAGPITQCR